MLLHKEPIARDSGSHPERPDRIRAIYGNLILSGLLRRCRRLHIREIKDQEVVASHSEELNKAVKRIKGPVMIGGDTYANKHTPLAARLAAGAVTSMALQVAHDKATNGFAIVRPPGHHAEHNKVCGFCLYNNVAVAAQAVLDKTSMSRILIVDWDVHHGNGVQYIFEEDPRVLYISLHRFGHGFYPGSGHPNEVGKGKGEGYNVNIAWSQDMMGNAEYLAAFDHVIMPIAREFDPELVLVSCGFDAARGDPLGGCDITPVGYAHMTAMLQTLANGRVVVALEGGYNLCSIAASAQAVVQTLLGDTVPTLSQHRRALKSSAMKDIRASIFAHRRMWRCLGVFQFAEDEGKKIESSSGEDEELFEDGVDDELWERAEAEMNRLRILKRKRMELDMKRKGGDNEKSNVSRWRGKISRRPWIRRFHISSSSLIKN